ncbi:Hypothetical protein NTJ_02244 [Nesidiocoris tenuis]|uniref:Uncharacterized protein n=1 Tax=Nesidiocoris tenuis TaxID=355587 RepID=A0ABN7AAU1_9HEMI|nr:Hypothetical protein NTJ_02244 [Nesidiocoris tenuis]
MAYRGSGRHTTGNRRKVSSKKNKTVQVRGRRKKGNLAEERACLKSKGKSRRGKKQHYYETVLGGGKTGRKGIEQWYQFYDTLAFVWRVLLAGRTEAVPNNKIRNKGPGRITS